MNDLNKITEVDLNPELAAKINKNHSNMVNAILYNNKWIHIYNPDDGTTFYRYMYDIPVVHSSMVDVIFDKESKEIALDCGMDELVQVLNGAIYFNSEEHPEKDLNVTIHYVV